MNKKRLTTVLLTALLTTTFIAGCQGGNGGGSDDDTVVKIGVFEPVTGENGGGGFQEVLGIRYANQEYPTVEIDGVTYDVELIEVDNKSDRTEAVSAAQSLISSGVSVIIGSYGSSVSIAAGEIFNDNRIPAIAPSATNPQVTLGNDYYFRVCFLDPFQGTVMANYAWNAGYTTTAIITQLGDDYSSGLGNFYKSAFTELGGTVLAEEQFQTNQTDFRAILTNINALDPEVIFAPSSITTAPLLIQQARELGIDAKIMAGDTWQNNSIIENAGEAAEGVTISTFYDEHDSSNEISSDFVTGFKAFINASEEYKTKNGGDGVAAVSALGYDAYRVALAAIEAAGSTTGSDIQVALGDVQYEGVTGSITFDENGDAIKNMAYIQVVEDGEFTFEEVVTIG